MRPGDQLVKAFMDDRNTTEYLRKKINTHMHTHTRKIYA